MQRRKRVALFANGWARECLQEIGHGICQRAEEADVDVFAFVNYSIHVSEAEEQRGEFNIFRFPDLKDFDGVLLLANSFNRQEETDYLYQQVMETGVPAVSLEYELEGLDYFGSDNYSGMHDLATHLIKEHGVRDILLVGGIESHEDSRVRVQAVLDAARENGICIPDGNIVYGSWSENVSYDCMEEWMKKAGALPEAIVCANDIMAIGVFKWLEEHRYRVPKDVKVTGYDCIERGQKYRPSITLINREWAGMGYRALQCLLDRINGSVGRTREMIRSRLVVGESCGCDLDDITADARPDLGREANSKKIEGVTSDQHFRHLYTAVRKVETLEEFHESLSGMFQQECWMEGRDFMLCIHPQFFGKNEDDDIFKVPGYSEEVDMICSLKDGVPEAYQRLPAREAMFRASLRSGKAATYIFVPVRSDDKNLGFAMLSRNFDVVDEYMLYIWTRHVNQYMEQVLSNVKIAELTRKLREMSVTDVLTGLYNRMGCEKILYPFVEACQNRGGRGIVMLADLDRMKTINDKYGHSQGDLALQTVADVLRGQLPEGFMAARFGGDEFFIVGESDKAVEVEEIAKDISRRLAAEVERRKIAFPLSISIGGVQLEPGEKFVLNDCLQRVDGFMYKVKERHHKRIDAQTAE